MKKIVEVYKCPNCNGKLEKTDNPNIMCCPYCGTEFETEDVTEEGNAKEEAPKEEAVEKETPKEKKEENKPAKAGEPGFNKPEWFEYRVEYKKLLKGKDSKEAMKTFSYCIDELGTSEAILKYIKREIIDEAGIYCKGHKEEKLTAFLKPLSAETWISYLFAPDAFFHVSVTFPPDFAFIDRIVTFDGVFPAFFAGFFDVLSVLAGSGTFPDAICSFGTSC